MAEPMVARDGQGTGPHGGDVCISTEQRQQYQQQRRKKELSQAQLAAKARIAQRVIEDLESGAREWFTRKTLHALDSVLFGSGARYRLVPAGPGDVLLLHDGETYTIGRGEAADIRCPEADRRAGRLHARLRVAAGLPPQLWVKDLDSKNGTFVTCINGNKEKIPRHKERELWSGNSIQCGRTTWRIVAIDTPGSTETDSGDEPGC